MPPLLEAPCCWVEAATLPTMCSLDSPPIPDGNRVSGPPASTSEGPSGPLRVGLARAVPKSHDLPIAGSAWLSLRPRVKTRMGVGSHVPMKCSSAGVHTHTPPPHTRGPSYVGRQHQTAVGSLPPPFASARAVGLPEILGNKGTADQGPR